ncbi:MAG: transcriptional regulator [Candidatus Spechtbacteria bacterium SB0662_bin_43]|uniref:Transcriptional regulator n=1 Tax=Candidatus Spechtbacteria bacterium SB0662_bin_43 TaxID=2604897 RepID=A0A845DCZ5_9BACT|nr:transcriptional regulator [Candidatus Spechtbacteria bacterium SB0662_bin_43]
MTSIVINLTLLVSMFPPLPNKKYSIIYADPPWHYKMQEFKFPKKNKKGKSLYTIKGQYDTVTDEDLKKLDIESISEDDSLLFMWAVSPKLKEGIELMEAWGFEYRTIAFVWHKDRSNRGNYTMSNCEICLVGKRGKIPEKSSHSEQQFMKEKVERHSQKPLQAYIRIQNMFPDCKRIELFSRGVSKQASLDIGSNFSYSIDNNWDIWGDQVID